MGSNAHFLKSRECSRALQCLFICWQPASRNHGRLANGWWRQNRYEPEQSHNWAGLRPQLAQIQRLFILLRWLWMQCTFMYKQKRKQGKIESFFSKNTRDCRGHQQRSSKLLHFCIVKHQSGNIKKWGEVFEVLVPWWRLNVETQWDRGSVYMSMDMYGLTYVFNGAFLFTVSLQTWPCSESSQSHDWRLTLCLLSPS